jgi:hypothetical protein
MEYEKFRDLTVKFTDSKEVVTLCLFDFNLFSIFFNLLPEFEKENKEITLESQYVTPEALTIIRDWRENIMITSDYEKDYFKDQKTEIITQLLIATDYLQLNHGFKKQLMAFIA